MADIETIRALLQREIEENNLIEEHARSIYNVPTRTPVTIQQRENARKAVARARALQVIPRSHAETKDSIQLPSNWY